MNISDARANPALRHVIRQGAVLLAIADLQDANPGGPAMFSSVVFTPGGDATVAARWPDGTRKSITLPPRPEGGGRAAIADLMGWSAEPLQLERRWPGQGNAEERLADLLRDLGSNCDALVVYRIDFPPLEFAAITSDGVGCDIVLRDPAGNEYRVRYDWDQVTMMATGDLYGIVDEIADAR
jgi:hypothetical protein